MRFKSGEYMSEFNDSNVLEIARQIESYLTSHPNAADTIEGIAMWWLPGKRIEESSLFVQQALDYLDSKSIVKTNVNISGNKVYSSNKARSEYQPNQ
jgi:hypothetical protein